MNSMQAIDIKFRCSGLGKIMPGPREKGEIAQGVLTHLVDYYVSAVYGRREDIKGKFLDKGTAREEDSITLLSRLHKKFYKKNDQRLTNDFISGECDIFLGESIEKADETTDTKTSWSAHTFFRAKQKELDEDYKWQGVGYMWLTGAKKHTVAYCLVNGTPEAILDEKRRLSYTYGIGYESNPKYIQECRQIEINHIFNLKEFITENPGFDLANDPSEWKWDIPMKARLHTFTFDRDEKEIDKLKNRIIDCRAWMEVNLFSPEPILNQ